MLHRQKWLPNNSGRPLNCKNFTDKKAKWTPLEVMFMHFLLLFIGFLSSPLSLFIYLFIYLFIIYLKGHWTTSASFLNYFFKKVEIFMPEEVYSSVVTA